MNYEEFGRISADFMDGNAACCGREMWGEVEFVYMHCNISKRELAFAFWRHTGYYETLAAAVKELVEEKRKFTLSEDDDETVTVLKCARLIGICSKIRKTIRKISELRIEFDKKHNRNTTRMGK